MAEQSVRIQLPLSLDLVASITKAMGVMYPGAKVRTDDWRHLTIVIDDKDRKPRVSRKALAEAKAWSEGDDTELTNLHDDGVSLTVPEALNALGGYAFTLLTEIDQAVNYVEQTMTYGDRPLYFIAAWSKGQTPHELRMKAEARIAELEKRIAEFESNGGVR